MPDQRLNKLTALIFSVFFLASCASSIEPLPRGSSLRIAVAPGVEFSNSLNFDGAVPEDIAMGAGVGSTIGALAASSACGPFFVLCAIGGGLAGGVTGAAAGGVYGVATAINDEERELLTQIFETVFSTKTQDQYIEEYFNMNARGRWRLEPVNADYTVTVRFDQFSVIQQSSDKFVLGLKASLTITDHDLQPDNESIWYSYQYFTPERDLSFFLDSKNENFKYEFERGLDALTNQMVNSF